jgi:hypothetical protein
MASNQWVAIHDVVVTWRGKAHTFSSVPEATQFLSRSDVSPSFFRTLQVVVRLSLAGSPFTSIALSGNKDTIVRNLQRLANDVDKSTMPTE